MNISTQLQDNVELNNILLRSSLLFMRFGIKSVTMDDVARELGISKKTLYKNIVDKDDLVSRTLELYLLAEQESVSAIVKGAKDAIEAYMLFSNRVKDNLVMVNPVLIFDLQKYQQRAWLMMEKHRNEFVLGVIEDNIRWGQKGGLYRADINPSLVAKIYTAGVYNIFDGRSFPYPKYKPAEVYSAIVDYHVNSIITAKGAKRYEALKEYIDLRP